MSPCDVLLLRMLLACVPVRENMLHGVEEMSITDLEDWGIGMNQALAWEEQMHNALMPITPQASMGSLADGQ